MSSDVEPVIILSGQTSTIQHIAVKGPTNIIINPIKICIAARTRGSLFVTKFMSTKFMKDPEC